MSKEDSIFWKIKAKILAWVSNIIIYKQPFFIVLPGNDHHYKIKGHHQREILSILKPGDVLLRKYDHYIGSIFIPGWWSHSALYVGDDHVIHMLGKGITKEDILTFMRCDAIEILRADDEKLAKEACVKAYEQLERGVGYDYDFSSTTEQFYCTELVSFCYNNPEFSKFMFEGKITPDDMKNSIWKTIWTSRK